MLYLCFYLLSQGTNLFYLALALVAIVVMIAIVTVFGIFLTKKNKLVQQNLEETLINQKKQHTLELQALRSQMNPHFVHNSLNAIQYYIQRNEVELSEIYLTKFSKLIRSFFELSRKQTITISQEIELLENYLEIEQLRFEDKLNYAIVKDGNLDEETLIPTMLLQPIVENAINHGIFHKEKSGAVEIHFEHLGEDNFKVSIADDGVGLEKSKAIFEKSGKKLNNRSTAVLKDRLKLLEHSKTWQVGYTLKNRTDTQGAIATLIFEPIEDDSTSVFNR